VHSLDTKLNDLIKDLKKENFDYVIDLHNNTRSTWLKFFLGKKTFTYKKYRWRRWLLVKWKINKMPAKHIADWYLDALKPLGVENDGRGLDYFLSPEDEITRSSLPATHQKDYVALVIGASEFTKKLPFAKLVELCKKINQAIILVGGKEDFEEGEKLAQYFDNQSIIKIYNACGKYSINQSASLIQQAKVVFGHDTGLTHIAAAFGKKIYAIYGGTSSLYLHPYTKDYILLENNNLTCRPCAKAGRENCPLGHFKCMNELTFDFEL
jgi:heptosyltransferase-2